MNPGRVLKRAFFYPLGIIRAIHNSGKNGSRDFYNSIRFKMSKIDAGTTISEDSVIGDNCHILENCTVNSSVIGAYTYIGKKGIVQNAVIGKFCSVASEVSLGLGRHPVDNFSTATLFYRKHNTLGIEFADHDSDFEEYLPIEIGHDVWIGNRAIIMDGISVGTGAVIAANSVVTKDVPPYAIVGGVPARVLRYRFNENKIASLLASEWWNWDLSKIKSRTEELNQP